LTDSLFQEAVLLRYGITVTRRLCKGAAMREPDVLQLVQSTTTASAGSVGAARVDLPILVRMAVLLLWLHMIVNDGLLPLSSPTG
jgi:hypothetical protein